MQFLSYYFLGKMAIEFAYELNKAIELGDIKANLIGAYLGDAWISPIESTLSWAPYLFQLVIQNFFFNNFSNAVVWA